MSIIRTPKLILFVAIITISLSCKNKHGEYIYYDKWVISNIYDMRPLKAKPKEVKEIYYNNLDDTTFEAPGPQSYYELYKFDDVGRIAFTRFSFMPMIADANYTYDDNGPKQHLLSYDSLGATKPRDESSLISEKISDGKFKISHSFDGKIDRYYIVSFSANGHIEKQERWLNEKLMGTITKHYKEDLLQQEEAVEEKEKTNAVYYYSDKGFPDSIIVFTNGKRSGSTVYIKNEHGDAVFYIKIENDKIEHKLRMKYQYDDKGNWIKQLTFTEIGSNNAPRVYVPGQKFPDYSLCIREIKY